MIGSGMSLKVTMSCSLFTCILHSRCTQGVERDTWETVASPALMSAAERGAYEEKKLKMRKAMGENLADAVAGEEPDARQRR